MKLTTKRKKTLKSMAIIFAAAYVLLALLPFTGPIAQFPLQVVRCMRLPMIASDYTDSYQTPTNKAYSVDLLTSGFFCSEQEAQAAGYEKATLGE